MPSAESQAVVAELWQRPANDNLSLDEWRHGAAWLSRQPLPDGWHGEAVDAGGVPCEWAWLEPGGSPDGPVIMVFHGGGFVVCDVPSYRRLSGRMGQAVGGRALAVEYRRAPEHVFPAAVEDCTTAYRWLLDQGVAPERIVFFGDSAGGNLCLSTALLAREQGLPLPAALVPVSPGAVDLTEEVPAERRAHDPFSRIDNRPRMLDAYLRGADPAHRLASPLHADLSGLPPMLVLVGPDEACLDVSLELVRRAAEQGVAATCEVVDGAFHTWLGYWGRVPESDAAIERIGAFVRLHVTAAAVP